MLSVFGLDPVRDTAPLSVVVILASLDLSYEEGLSSLLGALSR